MQNLLDELTELLQSEQAFISDGAILKNSVVEATLKMETIFQGRNYSVYGLPFFNDSENSSQRFREAFEKFLK